VVSFAFIPFFCAIDWVTLGCCVDFLVPRVISLLLQSIGLLAAIGPVRGYFPGAIEFFVPRDCAAIDHCHVLVDFICHV
jgi:hypothetical protein